MRVARSDGLRRRVLAAASLSFLLAAQAWKPFPPESLRWAEGASKCRARSSDGDGAIELSLSSEFWCFGVVGLFFVRLGKASWSKFWDHGCHDICLGATAGVRCSVVCRRGRGCCSGRLSFKVGVLSPRLWSSMRPKIAPGYPGCVVPSRTRDVKLEQLPKLDLDFPQKQFLSFFRFICSIKISITSKSDI